MKIINKKQFVELMEEMPQRGSIVFADYEPDVIKPPLMVTDGAFGATEVLPYHGEVFDFDWNIGEYTDTDLFAVLDNNDVLQMIQTLTRGLNIALSDDNEYRSPFWEA